MGRRKTYFVREHEMPIERNFNLLDKPRNEIVLLTLLAEWLGSEKPSGTLIAETKKVLGIENG